MKAFYVATTFELKRPATQFSTDVSIASALVRAEAETEEQAKHVTVGQQTVEHSKDWNTVRLLSCLALEEGTSE